MSTSYHPQTDGQTEIVNKSLECYLRCMTGEQPQEWVKWLPLAEFWYNTSFHSAINTTPFEVLYGQKPPIHVTYMAGDALVDAVDRSLQAREAVIDLLKFHLKRAQDRMKTFADKKRTDRVLDVGSWVFVKLQPHRQVTLRLHKQHKLSPKYYGPFKVVEKVGQVAYRLLLPPNATVHSVFHVSQLKPYKGQPLQAGSLPPCDSKGCLIAVPMKVLDRKIGKLNNKAAVYWLIQWSNGDIDDATWELATNIQDQFPEFVADS